VEQKKSTENYQLDDSPKIDFLISDLMNYLCVLESIHIIVFDLLTFAGCNSLCLSLIASVWDQHITQDESIENQVGNNEVKASKEMERDFIIEWETRI